MLDNRAIEPHTGDERTTRVVYTCWPFGGVVCGVCLLLTGIALMLQRAFPANSELVWGSMLLVLGGFIVLRHWRRDDR